MSAVTAPTIRIRDAAAADAPALARLLGQLGYPTTPSLVVVRLADLAAGGLTRILIAAGGEAIGFLALTRMDILPYVRPLARITALCVDEDCRCAGVGRLLEEHAAEIARGWGCEKIEVTSNRRRARAHGFYERYGYEDTHRCFVKRLRETEREGVQDASG